MTCEGCAPLPDRGVLRITGEDTIHFLQGLVSNDMALLSGQGALYAGLLSPQGKLLFDMLIVAAPEGGVWIDVARTQVPDLVRRLALYKLRAKVTIEDRSGDLGIEARLEAPAQAGGDKLVFADPRRPELGARAIVPASTAEPSADEPYHRRRIALGVPEGGHDYRLGELFPHEAMLDQLNGVSFSKGCYVGQEIVSRMQHRGTARSRFLIVQGESALPPQGTEVLAGAAPIGSMGSSRGKAGLALIRLDRLERAYKEQQPIAAGGVSLTLMRPAYVSFAVPPAPERLAS